MTSFNGLLKVMEDSEYQHVKELAKQIKMNILKNISTTDNMQYVISGVVLHWGRLQTQ